MYAISERVQRVVYEQEVKSGMLASLLTINRQRQEALDRLLTAPDAAGGEDYSRIQALAGQLSAKLDELRGASLSEAARGVVAAASDAAANTQQVRDAVLQLLMQGDRDRAAALARDKGVASQQSFHNALDRLLELEHGVTREAVVAADGSLRQAWLLVGAAGLLALLIGAWIAHKAMRQITRSEAARHRDKELAEVTLLAIGDGVITTNEEGGIEYMNPAAERFTGWNCAEARGRPLDEVYRVVDEQTGKPLPYANSALAQQEGARGVTVKLLGRSETSCAVRDSYAPIHGHDGAVVGRVVVFHDVSQIHAMAQQLTWQASHDALTGLANRREFERHLGELVDSAQADGKQHALMYMDLDNFKTVNDTCGHAAGDEMLRQLTTVMLSKMRGSDTLARVGGDEFGGLLESCPLDQAVRIANGLREAVRDFRFIWKDKTFGVGISIGLVPIDADSGGPNRVLATADATCYEAKSKGRDRVQVYRPSDGKASAQRGELQMVSQINHAFELGSFRLYRQKIIKLNGAENSEPHYEILVRMIDRAGDLIPPSGFMPAAERFNLLSSIERWVISSLVEFLHRQFEDGTITREQAARANAFYAVNLSAASISDASFPEFVRNLLTRFDLPRGLLCFEVTETTAISNLTKAAQLMHELQGLGCRFALDDFGIGMSSFAYLKYLPVDYIKIDGVFVRDMATDQMDYAIVEAINRIAHILGLKTVAEFVEDEATLARLRMLGVDYAQGYFIAKPEALVKTALEHAVLESV